MNVNKCRDCRRYKYLINSTCRDCMYDGVKSLNNSECIHNRFNRGKTQLTIGQSRSGVKESTVAEFIREMSQKRDDICIHIIDPLNHYQSTVNKLGGEELRIDSKNPINPFGIPETIDFIKPEIYNIQLMFSTAFLTNLLSSYQLSQSELTKISEAVIRKMYAQKGSIVGSSNPKSPSISDFKNIIDEAIDNPKKVNLSDCSKFKISNYKNIIEKTDTDVFSASQPYKEPNSRSNNLRHYKTGLSNKTGLIQKELIKKIYISAMKSDKDHLLISDESQLMIGYNFSKDLQKIIKNDLNDNFSLNMAIKSVKAIVKEPKLVRRFSSYRIHRYSFSERERKVLGIPKSDSKFLADAKRIGRGSNKSSCLIKDGSSERKTSITLTDEEMELAK